MKKGRIFFSWFWVILCAASIFAIVPLARSIQNLVTRTLGRAAFGYFVLFSIALFFVLIIWLLVFRLKIRRISSYLCLTLVSSTYVYFTLKLWAHPEEAIHFLEYGLLSFLLFRALRNHFSDLSIYFSALFLGSFVGLLDEILQWITPKRYWDFRDVGLNALAVFLFQIALAFGLQPRGISLSISPRSLRFASLTLAANLILLGLCFSNTPQRVAQYSRFLPGLSFLEKEEIMHDFQIKKHHLPGLGIFFSRLELEELKMIDRQRGKELANLLHQWAEKPYEEFLRTFGAQKEPFLHEFRVRLFRRDQKLKEAQQLPPGRKKDKALLAAYRENLFLERYFGQTLRLSGKAWPDDLTYQLAKKINPKTPYRSPVGAGFWLFRSELTLWLTIIILLLILAMINLIFAFLKQEQKKKNQPAGGIEPSTC
ncbi:MAG: VanZ family protein [Candidatus Aminicenantes bacterium]|nr:VanZ family protein [Candidatus Aminicenantes bacterium]